MVPARADHHFAQVQGLEPFEELEQGAPVDDAELVVTVGPEQERVHRRAEQVDVAELPFDLFVGFLGRVRAGCGTPWSTSSTLQRGW
jgi:hypothetical protein